MQWPRPRSVETRKRAVYLRLQPPHRWAVELHIRRSIREAVRDLDIWEVLEDATLHRQLVQIRIEHGEDALWQVGRLGCIDHLEAVV